MQVPLRILQSVGSENIIASSQASEKIQILLELESNKRNECFCHTKS
jgi:hypothetical protein